jgi:hypothetical protein
MLLAVIASALGTLLNSAAAQSQGRTVRTTDTLGSNARQAMINIFRKKGPTAVDRNFGESFIQHDSNITDGLAGMKSFAAEVASSPAADITIHACGRKFRPAAFHIPRRRSHRHSSAACRDDTIQGAELVRPARVIALFRSSPGTRAVTSAR